jgi:hypothetical protein
MQSVVCGERLEIHGQGVIAIDESSADTQPITAFRLVIFEDGIDSLTALFGSFGFVMGFVIRVRFELTHRIFLGDLGSCLGGHLVTPYFVERRLWVFLGFCCRDGGEKGKGSAKQREEREACGVVSCVCVEGLKRGAWVSFGCASERSCEERGGMEEAEGRTAEAVDSLRVI